MRLLYLSTARIPGEKANTYQVLQMCDALAQRGVEITLLHPCRTNTPAMRQVQDIQGYYGLCNVFPMVSLPTLDLIWASGKLFSYTPRVKQIVQNRLFPLLMATYTRSVLRYLRRHTADVYYLRSTQILWALLRVRPDLAPRIVYEAHTFPQTQAKQKKVRSALPQIGGVVTITHQLKTLYTQTGIPPEKILVAPDGVDLRRFADLPEKHETRRLLNLPEDEILVCYTGHLYPWKGVDTLARSSHHLSSNYQICIVGGMPDDVAKLQEIVAQENLSRVRIVGYISPSQAPLYMTAADVLALPNSGQHEISRRYTSPLKLFEYMASERPIVASDLPSLREVLNEQNAVLVRPDDPKALAEGIYWLVTHPDAAQAMAKQARADVQQYTWSKRAERILSSMNRSNQSVPQRRSSA